MTQETRPFDPLGAMEKAREELPLLDAALKRSEEEKEAYLSPVVEYFLRLRQEVEKMEIASRFRRDKAPDLTYMTEVPNPFFTGDTEDEHKRLQLLADVDTLLGQATSLIGGVERVVMDIEATRTEG